jgi:hypothetical protein
MTGKSVPGPKLAGILICFFLSGAAGLIDQVAWAKALGLIFGHTAYAVATVLAVFMAGLAAGSAYLGSWGEGRPEPIALYARIEFLVGATSGLSLAGLAGVRSLYIAAYPVLAGSRPLLLALRFAKGFSHRAISPNNPDGGDRGSTGLRILSLGRDLGWSIEYQRCGIESARRTAKGSL